jgi:hypothetical protein
MESLLQASTFQQTEIAAVSSSHRVVSISSVTLSDDNSGQNSSIDVSKKTEQTQQHLVELTNNGNEESTCQHDQTLQPSKIRKSNQQNDTDESPEGEIDRDDVSPKLHRKRSKQNGLEGEKISEDVARCRVHSCFKCAECIIG